MMHSFLSYNPGLGHECWEVSVQEVRRHHVSLDGEFPMSAQGCAIEVLSLQDPKLCDLSFTEQARFQKHYLALLKGTPILIRTISQFLAQKMWPLGVLTDIISSLCALGFSLPDDTWHICHFSPQYWA